MLLTAVVLAALISPEEAWIASSVHADLSGMAQRAPKIPPAGPVGDHAWSPAGYASLARDLLSSSTKCPPTPSVAVAPLLEPTRATLQEQDEQVSRRLSACLRDQGAHEDAALLVAAFALREAAGHVSDVRPALNRMTAHLAAAEALRAGKPPSPAGRLAALAADALTGRTAPAVSAIAAARAGRPEPAETAWLDALELRATGDWRPFLQKKAASLLVRREVARAMSTRWSAASAEKALEPGDLADVGAVRVLLIGDFTVDQGHRFLDEYVDREASETSGLPAEIRPWRLVEGGKVGVLGAAAWSASAARHVANAALVVDVHLMGLGLPDERHRFRRRTLEQFASFVFRPLVLGRWELAPTPALGAGRTGCGALGEMIARQPELVAPAHWRWSSCGADRSVGQLARWLSVPAPRGTALDAASRVVGARLSGAVPTPDAIAAIPRLDPYSAQLPWATLPPNPTSTDWIDALRPVLDYDRHALAAVAGAVAFDEWGTWGEKLCQLRAESCFALGDWHAGRAEADAAERAYLRGIEGAADGVAVSNNLRWLALRRLQQGRTAEALALAERAGSSGSARGLSTQAAVLEKLGRIADAEAIYQQIAVRYDSQKTLDGFVVRQGRNGPYATRAQEIVRRVFPDGIGRWSKPTGPPKSGLLIRHIDVDRRELARRIGIGAGHVLVAVNGIPVSTVDQYALARDLPIEDETRVTLWRDGGYADVVAVAADRRLGLRMQPFVLPPAPVDDQVGPLLAVFTSPTASDVEVQQATQALSTLRVIAAPGAEAALEHPHPRVRARAAALALQVGSFDTFERVAALVSDSDATVRLAAMQALGGVFPMLGQLDTARQKPLADAAGRAAGDPDVEVARSAIRALAAGGGASRGQLPALQAAAKRHELASEATAAIERIGKP